MAQKCRFIGSVHVEKPTGVKNLSCLGFLPLARNFFLPVSGLVPLVTNPSVTLMDALIHRSPQVLSVRGENTLPYLGLL
jgi:hypothetical protein